MSQSIEFLKPTYYVSKEDEQLKAIVRMISTHKQEGGLNGHALAVAKAAHSIVLALLVNTPYYLALGSKNLFLNCINLNKLHRTFQALYTIQGYWKAFGIHDLRHLLPSRNNLHLLSYHFS